MKKVELKITEGLVQPRSLIESCEVLGMCKVRIVSRSNYFIKLIYICQTFQDECEAKQSERSMSCEESATQRSKKK